MYKCCVCSILLQVEGVDSHGGMYLLRRPDHAEIEARLWRLYFEADNEKEDYKNRLKFKVRYVQCNWC